MSQPGKSKYTSIMMMMMINLSSVKWRSKNQRVGPAQQRTVSEFRPVPGRIKVVCTYRWQRGIKFISTIPSSLLSSNKHPSPLPQGNGKCIPFAASALHVIVRLACTVVPGQKYLGLHCQRKKKKYDMNHFLEIFVGDLLSRQMPSLQPMIPPPGRSSPLPIPFHNR